MSAPGEEVAKLSDRVRVIRQGPQRVFVERKISPVQSIKRQKSGLMTLRDHPIDAFVAIEAVSTEDDHIFVIEEFVKGALLAHVLDGLAENFSAKAILSWLLELAVGLRVLHQLTDRDGNALELIHGSVGLDSVYLTSEGSIKLGHFEGLCGDVRGDIEQFVDVTRRMLDFGQKDLVSQGLMQSLHGLSFGDMEAVERALLPVVRSFDAETLHRRRIWLADALLADVSTSPGLANGAKVISASSEDAERHLVKDALLHPASSPMNALEPSIVSFGAYEIVASIGRGGMGEVYLARSEDKGRTYVALKVLTADREDRATALAMLMDEAALMARVDHSNVLKVLDFGEFDERFYLASEYLRGRPLSRLLVRAYESGKPLDYAVVTKVAQDSARGLHAAHEARGTTGEWLQIVHRDVSPQNLFITYDGVTKVIDFGVARARDRISRTQVGILKGKAAYMSPEQVRGQPLDARADVFSLGTCIWEMIAGRRLFKRNSEYETLMAVLEVEAEPPTSFRSKRDPDLDRIVLNMLEKDRDNRTESALLVAEAMAAYGQNLGLDDLGRLVKVLMQDLFRNDAEEELRLVNELEMRSVTQREVLDLRRISSVAALSDLGELSLVGEDHPKSGLDAFGDPLAMTPHDREREVTRDRVLNAVARYAPDGIAPATGRKQEPIHAAHWWNSTEMLWGLGVGVVIVVLCAIAWLWFS
jgi:eukaryotic-like serine/threonine-protein kinase